MSTMNVKKIILGFTLFVVMSIIYSKYLNKTSEPNRQNNRSDISASSEIKRKQNEAEQRKKNIEARSREFARAHNLRDMSLPEIRFQFTNEQGMLTKQAINAIGLTTEQAEIFQQKYDILLNSVKERTRKNLVEDTRNSKPEQGIYAYKVPADVDFVEGLFGAFLTEMGSVVGKKELLFLKSGLYGVNDFGQLGTRDINIVVKDQPDQNGVTNRLVDYTYSDPETGTVNIKGQCTAELFMKRFHSHPIGIF